MNSPANKLLILAPAKINWTLDVLGKRDDGYHEIESIMQTLTLVDFIGLSRRAEPGIGLTLSGRTANGVPADASNIAHQAAALILSALGCSSQGIDIVLIKCIPSQAGLGGGSSDAAAVLLGVNRLLGDALGISDLYPIAKQLGADVSFFLQGGTARLWGIGEKVEPIESGPDTAFVIVKPTCGVSTADAYHALDKLPDRQRARATARWPEGGMSNDFEAVVFDLAPDLRRTRQALLNAGATRVLLCGSGSALAAFSPEPDALFESTRQMDMGEVVLVKPWDNLEMRMRILE